MAMRVLLDTNILIHREASTIVRRDIGKLFFWLDRLRCDKVIHPASVQEIGKHQDPRVRASFQTKLESYHLLKTTAHLSPAVEEIAASDRTDNDRNDTLMLLQDFGFTRHGTKTSEYGTEDVYVRSMARGFDSRDPKQTFPFVSRSSRSSIVPIYPEYHTNLLPDSILHNESPTHFIEQEPHRNAIRKVYVCRSYFRELRRGDTIVFYRTGGYHKAVVTTLGIVDGIYQHIANEDQFISLCRKRSVFSDDELRKQWRYRREKPLIVGFLYSYAFPKRPTLKELIQHGIIRDVDSAPRGFEALSPDQFDKILELSGTDLRIVVD